jgi:DNA-binding PadR family transcriptional regulator
LAYRELTHVSLSFQSEAPLKGILSIAIVDLIKDKSAHGSEIHQSLKEQFQIDTPRGIFYNILRRMESDGLIGSNWDIQENSRARRIYRIIKEGLDYLKISMKILRPSRQLIMILLGENL